jgi:RNA polymerase sigma-70 factor (ECF subfamily)
MTRDGDRNPDPDDGRLVRRVAGGDEAAFMTLYDRHSDALYGTTVRFLRDRESAAEVLQDVFVAIWQRAAQYDPRSGTVAGWLFGIARNRAIDRLRAEARRPRSAYGWASGPDAPDAADLLDRAGRWQRRSPDGDPVLELDRSWTRALVRTTLAEMPADERDVVVLAYDQALSQSEIAARLGLPIGTVKSRTRRALARLRGRLADVPDLRFDERRGRDLGAGPADGPAGTADDRTATETVVREIDR